MKWIQWIQRKILEAKLKQMAIELLKAIALTDEFINVSASKESWRKVLKYIGIKNPKIDIKPLGTSAMIQTSSSLRKEQSIINSFRKEIKSITQEKTAKELLDTFQCCLEKHKNLAESTL